MAFLAIGAKVGIGRVEILREAEQTPGYSDMDDAYRVFAAHYARHAAFYDVRTAVHLATWVLVIGWLYRSAKNAGRIDPTRMTVSPKWAIWGWFVPILNLARPFQVVNATWNASARSHRPLSRLTLVATWWALVVGSTVGSLYVNFQLMFSTSFSDKISEIHLTTAASLLYMVAGLPLIVVIGRVTQLQDEAALGCAPPPTMPSYVLPEADQVDS